MKTIKVSKLSISQGQISLRTFLRSFIIKRSNISKIEVMRIPSFFEEIAIRLYCGNVFVITERIDGFFDLASFLELDKLLGPDWYHDAEEGKILSEECQ